MLGFGKNKKKEEEEEKAEKARAEQTAQAMRSMSDQLAEKGKEIADLEKQLEAAKKEATSGDTAEKALAQAQTKMRQMQAEMAKMQAEAAKAKAEAVKAASTPTGTPGVTKIGPATPASTSLGGAAEAPAAGGLAVGVTAFVRQTGGKNLRLRNGPGLDTNAFDGLAPGTSMTLLEGPLQKDNYPWWRIRTIDGREGWVAGTELVTTPE
jgi:alanyl-tRNA synthetase